MTMTVPDPPIPDTPATQLVRHLVERRPARMSELEAIMGPLAGPIAMSFRDEDHENMGWLDRPRNGKGEFTALVPRLRVEYRFDMYHERPTRPRDVGLESFTLEVRGDAALAERILREELGATRTVVDGATRYAAVHPFYVARDPSAPDRFRLSWYAEVPRFAIPTPDPQARAAWLRALARRIAIARSVDEVAAFCKDAPAAAGIEIVGTLNSTANPHGRPTKDPRDYWIKFVPPVRATAVAAAFEWGMIVGVTHDVHMSTWLVERQADTWLPTAGADAQWEIRATFTKSPDGGPVKHGRAGPFSARGVDAADELHSLAIGPRFK
ncbi:MAG TPA: hypothetical protein VNO30_34210 [Kofleriaceae bacterium]|nr:hypothetical protein [Kofleriaceae bacterium]